MFNPWKRWRERVPYTRPRRIRWWWTVVGVVALAAVASTVFWPRDVDIAGEIDPPEAYRIVYRIGGHEQQEQRQVLTVRRPYHGRNETGPPGGPSTLGILTARDGAWRVQDGRLEFLGTKAPSTPAGDARPLLAMAHAVRLGLARPAGSDRIAGRDCLRFATGEPPGNPLAPPGPLARVELCIDAQGLVLQERVYRGRTLDRLREAVEVEVDPTLGDELFGEGFEQPDEPGARFLGADPGLAALSRPPAGFELDGVWEVEPSADDVATIVESWVRTSSVILVERTRSRSAPWRGYLYAQEIDLDNLGTGELIVDLIASSVHFQASDGTFVRVVATLPPDQVVAVAREIRP